MTRVLHTGDTHIGYRQYHSPERREDFLSAFRRVVDDAVESDVDAVVHAGDLFHDRRPGLPDLLGTLEVLETLDEANVPFLAVVGNHETKRDAQWLDLFEAMGLATRLGDSPTVVGDTALYGLDFVPRARRADLEYDFDPHDADHAALVGHGLFEPLVPDYGNVEWDVAEVLEAATVDFDAVLLGDEHAATRQEVDGAWVTYCGSTERTNAAEREARGYNLVEFDGEVRISRRGIETRAFVFVDVDLADGEGFDRIRDRLREHDLADAVVHVTVDGDGEEVSAAQIEGFALEEGALVARVNDRRELTEGTDVDVVFSDPDEAVRERVRQLGLSRAARDIDETIRASKVADTNVADEVERAVADLLDEPGAFDPAPAEPVEDSETVAERLDTDGEAPEDAEGSDDTGSSPPGAENDDDADGGGDADGPGPVATTEAASGNGSTQIPADSAEDEGAEPRDDDRSGADDQASVEDFL